MTSIYVLKVGDAAAKQWISFAFEKTLNAMSNAQLALDGVAGGYVAEFDTDKEVFIYNDGNLKFRGTVFTQQKLSGGGFILTCLGIEHELADKKAPIVSGTTRAWSSTSINTIFNTLVISVSGWTTDVSNSTADTIDFRTSSSESVWNAMIRLISNSGRDILVDQENKVVFLYDELTADNQFSFIEGKNAKDISRNKSRSIAGKVTVYGKGDGENQIAGSFGAGTPEVSLIDRNILTNTEAIARATVEYDKLNPNKKSYTLTPLINVEDLEVGDAGQIINTSASINEEVDIVRIKTMVDGNGTEKIDMEVTNPAFRIASKSAAESKVISEANYNQSQSSMQGSGNLSQWGGQINGDSSFGLTVPFNIDERFEDEAGNLRIDAMTVDYDVDKYSKQVGTASFDGSDPQVQNESGNAAPAVEDDSGSSGAAVSGESGSSGPATWTTSFSGTSASVGSGTLDDSSWETITNTGIIELSTDLVLYFATFKNTNAINNRTILMRANMNGTFYPSSSGTFTNLDAGDYATIVILMPVDVISQDIVVEAQSDSGNMTYEVTWNWQAIGKHVHDEGNYAAAGHTHDEGTYNAVNHPHPRGDYDILASDLDNISIGDAVSEAGSLNATSVDIHLDFWNGSAWVLDKYTVIATGETLERGVDITDSGTYPDAKGLWRIRILTDNASPDLIKGIVNVKHNLDN